MTSGRYTRYGWVEDDTGGGSGLTPEQEMLLADLSIGELPGVSNTNSIRNRLVVYIGTTFETIKPVKHYTSEVSRHHMSNVLDMRYKEGLLNDTLYMFTSGNCNGKMEAGYYPHRCLEQHNPPMQARLQCSIGE